MIVISLQGQKFRDELKTRQGLLRSKEFIMKDLYSFDLTEESAMETYGLVGKAYNNIFKTLSLPFYVVTCSGVMEEYF